MNVVPLTNAFERSKLATGAALFMICAGLIHLLISPTHYAHAPAHGLFFVIMGVVQVIWGIFFWRQPSVSLYRSGVILAGSLFTLWAITRVLPAPFEHSPGTIDLAGILCKTSELMGIALLVAIVLTGVSSHQQRQTVWRSVTVLILVAFVGGWISYGVGYALQPLFPMLQGGTEHDESSTEDAGNADPAGDDSHTTGDEHQEATPKAP